jgi:DNA-directed RNA polymerase subunit RPC12/RpoP
MARRQEDHPMDDLYCNDCGAKVDETPALLPDQRVPCPRCGSLARRFEQTIASTVLLSDGGTAAEALSVTPTDGPATIAHAEAATLTVTAHDATAQTVNAQGIPGADQVGDATVVRDPRMIRDHLVVQARSLWWTQLTEEGGWLLQVVDEAGEEIATAANYDPVEALAAVAIFILPGHPG